MFAEKLKELRKKNGYSMDTLVKLYNQRFNGKLNKSTLSRYENGLQEPMFSVVKNLADFFYVSVDELINSDSAEKDHDVSMDNTFQTANNNQTLLRIIKQMIDLGISEEKFVKDLDINPDVYNDWKKGKSESYMGYLDSIAQYLGLSRDYLLSGERYSEQAVAYGGGSINLQDNSVDNQLNVQEKELLRIYRSIAPKEQAKLMLYAYELEDTRE